MKRLLTYISVSYLALWSVFFPDSAHALVVHKIRCEEMPNKFWTPAISKSYARGVMQGQYGWGRTEFKALNKLWNAESHWNPSAYNTEAGDTDGSHAGGIPQILALDPRTPAPVQIDRGLAYIAERYGKPSVAWAHHRAHGWY
jgi:hypothetical protein